MKKNYFFLLAEIFFITINFFFASCKSSGYFPGNAPLTVMIVDEQGQGVRDFQLVLSNFNNSQKGITNENGLCSFDGIPAGEYELSGQKVGYSLFKAQKFIFSNKCDVFCFRVMSGNYVFTQVQKLYQAESYEEGILLLDKLFCEKKSLLKAAVYFFKAYAYAATGNKKEVNNELKKLASTSKEFEEKYSVAVKKLRMEDESK